MTTDRSVGGTTPSIIPAFALGTSTSIGSLPHVDRQAAIAFVLDRCPALPAAPSLPNLDRRELMVAQGLWGVDGVTVAGDGGISVDSHRVDIEAPLGDPGLLGPPFETLQAFLTEVSSTTGPVKLQIPGPITIGLVLCDAGLPADLAFRLAGVVTRGRARQLLSVVRRSLPESPLIVFVDEPGLVGGLGARIPLGADQAIDLVSSVLAVLEHEAITGVHCCGPADWKAVIQTGTNIVSLPAHPSVAASAGALSSFIERGGWAAWGAVPTDGPRGESPARLWRELSTIWCELVRAGCDPVCLRRQALITPECGLAGHSVAQAEHVFDLSRQVGERLADQLANVQLSVGA